MARLRGWAPRGERCRAAIPHGHWKTTTFTAGLRLGGLAAPWCSTARWMARPSWSTSGACWCPTHAGRHRDHGQPPRPQGGRGARGDRGGRRAAALPAAVLPGLQSDRDGLLEAQGSSAKGGRQNRRRAMDAIAAILDAITPDECHNYFQASDMSASICCAPFLIMPPSTDSRGGPSASPTWRRCLG